MVSIIIPTYSRARYLDRAIKSLINQTYKNIEIIIVDDNGRLTENQIETAKIVEKYKNIVNIKYIVHEKNMNGSVARNTGIRNSSGDFICFLDDDDEFLPKKIEKQVNLLKSLNGQWGGCYCGHIRIYESSKYYKYISGKCGKITKDILCRNIDMCSGSTLMIRKSILNKIGLFDETFKRFQDIEFVLKISEQYKIAVLEESLVKIYTHSGSNIEKNINEIIKNRMYFLEKFQYLICGFDEKDRNDIYFCFYIELAKECLKKGEFKKSAQFILKSKYRLKAIIYILNDSVKFIIKKIKLRRGKFNEL